MYRLSKRERKALKAAAAALKGLTPQPPPEAVVKRVEGLSEGEGRDFLQELSERVKAGVVVTLIKYAQDGAIPDGEQQNDFMGFVPPSKSPRE